MDHLGGYDPMLFKSVKLGHQPEIDKKQIDLFNEFLQFNCTMMNILVHQFMPDFGDHF